VPNFKYFLLALTSPTGGGRSVGIVRSRTKAMEVSLVYLGFQCLHHPPYSPDMVPSDYHLFLGLKKTIERSLFFNRRGSYCCLGDLVGRTTFWIFFFEWLAEVRAKGL